MGGKKAGHTWPWLTVTVPCNHCTHLRAPAGTQPQSHPRPMYLALCLTKLKSIPDKEQAKTNTKTYQQQKTLFPSQDAYLRARSCLGNTEETAAMCLCTLR